MSGAEIVDAWRLYPRVFLTWYAAVVTKLVFWYMAIQAPSAEQTAMIGGIVGLCVPLVNWYMKNGKQWDSSSASSQDTGSTS